MSTSRAMVPAHRWLSLAAAVNERMAELGLDQADLAEESGISPQIVRDLQRGVAKAYRPTTLVRVATALEWPADALPRILNDLPVTPTSSPATTSGRRDVAAGGRAVGRGSAPTVAALESQVVSLERTLADLRRELSEVRRGA